MQLFDAAQEGLHFARLGGICVLGLQLREFDHQFLALRQELVERRIQGAHDHRIAVHDLEEFDEVLALHGQQLAEGGRTGLVIFGEDHLADVRDAFRLEEHVFRAAKSDAFRAEHACCPGIARSFGVRANARLAVLVDDRHELGEVAGSRIRVDRGGLAGEHFAGRTVDRNPVPFAQLVAIAGDRAGLRIHVHVARSSHARRAHAARHDSGVRSHAPARREDALGRFHAMDVFRGGLGADEHDGPAFGSL